MLLPLASLLLLAVRATACSFVALQAPPGGGLAAVAEEAAPYYAFLQTRACPPNDDGYGLLVYRDRDPAAPLGFFATGSPVWYGHADGRVLDEALAALRDPGRPATQLLGHARNGSGGLGSHPFRFDWNGSTWAFMHNGDLSDGDATCLKEGLLSGLLQSGWFDERPRPNRSNWKGRPEDVDSWIDSELLFHYLMARIVDAGGDVIAGLEKALNEEDWHGFDVRAQLVSDDPAADPASVINFVLSDGRSLFVYRNSRPEDERHFLAWRADASGLVGVLTDHPVGFTPLEQYGLMEIPPSGGVIHHGDVRAAADGLALDARPGPGRLAPRSEWGAPRVDGESVERPGSRSWSDGAAPTAPAGLELLSAHPNPFNARTTLRVRLAAAADLRATVFDLLGRPVATVFDGPLPAGEQDLAWDGRTASGAAAASGVYSCVLSDGRAVRAVKLLLIQ